jgi:polar amino acid transport system substrate-binding protein
VRFQNLGMGINRLVLLVMTVAPGLLTHDVSTAVQIDRAARDAVAPTGRLRVGVYPGSPTSMIRDQASGEQKGLSVDLGREFARRLEIPAELVEFRQIADVLEALKQGLVDFTVTNSTPARAKDVDFSSPILGVELGYLVPSRSTISALVEIDRPGIRVGVTAGGSSHTTLSRELMHATVVPAPAVAAGITMLAEGKIEAYATNKAILYEMSDQLPGSRVLDGKWGIETFAIGIPKGRGSALPSVRSFADAVKSEGLVKRAAERAGLRGIVNIE